MSKWKENRAIKVVTDILFWVSVAALTFLSVLLYVAYYYGALSDNYSSIRNKTKRVYNSYKWEIEQTLDEFYNNGYPQGYRIEKTNDENAINLVEFLSDRLNTEIWNSNFYKFGINLAYDSYNNTYTYDDFVVGSYTDEFEYDYNDSFEYMAEVGQYITNSKSFNTEEDMEEFMDSFSNYYESSFSESEYDPITEKYVCKYEYYKSKTVYITVYSYVNNAVAASDPAVDNYIDNDSEIYDSFEIIGFIHENRNAVYALFIIAAVIMLITFAMSMIHAGHKKGMEDTGRDGRKKAPYEIFFILIAGAILLAAIDGVHLIDSVEAGFSYVYESGVGYILIRPGIMLGLSAMFACCIELINIILRVMVGRIKTGLVKNDFITYRFAKKHFGKESGIRLFFSHLLENIPFLIKAVIIYLFCIAIEFFALAGMNISGFILAVNIVLTIIYFVFVLQIRMLYEGGKELAKGNFEHTIDTKNMFWCFKKHGEHLNSIKEGLADAVTERMKSERMKTELITNVSHDIKTPLTSIINYVDLLDKEGIKDEPESSYIEVLKRQSQRLKKLTDDLVEASKASSGALSVNLEPMDINMIVNQASAEYVDKLNANHIKLIINNSEEPAYIMADGRHLWRVIDNLFSNACKYAMPDTRLYVDVTAGPEKVRLMIKNISKEQLNINSSELMERFVRGDQSRNTEGSGLGLSISLSLCQLMNAEFYIDIDGDLFKANIVFDRIGEPKVKLEKNSDN